MPSEMLKLPDGYATWLDYWTKIPIPPNPHVPYLRDVREAASYELAELRERVKRLESELAETRAASQRNVKDYSAMGGL